MSSTGGVLSQFRTAASSRIDSTSRLGGLSSPIRRGGVTESEGALLPWSSHNAATRGDAPVGPERLTPVLGAEPLEQPRQFLGHSGLFEAFGQSLWPVTIMESITYGDLKLVVSNDTFPCVCLFSWLPTHFTSEAVR